MSEIKNSGRGLQLINVILFIGLLTVGGIASLVPKKAAISEMENRAGKLEQFLKSKSKMRQILLEDLLELLLELRKGLRKGLRKDLRKEEF